MDLQDKIHDPFSRHDRRFIDAAEAGKNLRKAIILLAEHIEDIERKISMGYVN